MAFDSREYEWADITVILAGRDVTGLRGIKYSEKQEKEAIYAKGCEPHLEEVIKVKEATIKKL